jgi:hypothetical protein
MTIGVTNWIKSTYSDGEGANCVEWAPTHAHGTVRIRDSKTPHSTAVAFGPDAWSVFIRTFKDSSH